MLPISRTDLRVSLDHEPIIRRITNRIRQTLELEDILATTTVEMRSLLGTDRVVIYKFHPDGSGQVIAESIHQQRLPSLLGLNFPADDIPPHTRDLFTKSRVRSIVNVETREIVQVFLKDLANGETILEDIHHRSVEPCHLEYLSAMGVKSTIVAPILHQNQLWGLLVSHHSESSVVSEYELEAVQMVVDQLSVAIAQSTLLTQARQKAEQETIINQIATLLHSLPTIVLQPALDAAVAAFNGSGGRLCIRNEASNLENHQLLSLVECLQTENSCIQVYTCGQQPVMPTNSMYPLIEQCEVWQEYYNSGKDEIWAIADIYEIPELQSLYAAFQATNIRSILMIPLQYRQQLLGYLSIFRNEIDTETLWAGQFDPDQRQLYPRMSFDAWRESKQAQAQQWTKEEINLAREIAKHFASGIQQYELYQQVQAFNSNLEDEVQKRTYELQRSSEQQQAVFAVITKIRDSLDIDTIFQTTTKEVCELLKSDRVSVYRFDANWGGKFVGNYEATSQNWFDGSQLGLNTVWNDTYLQDTQGGRYRNNETLAVHDIYQMGFTQCHIDNLQKFQIHAFILAPIFVGQQLWGLLATYQHSGNRQWTDSEINFFSQIAAQIGVALQQAELLAQTQKQTQQITQALHDLQAAQTQLIQTEKMSSLGQLVAGIAHEINNPVNFIYGNLAHVSEYAHDLLEMLELYEQHSMNTVPEIIERAEEIDLGFITEDLPKTLTSMKIGIDRIRQIVLGLRNFSRLDEAEMKAVNIHEGLDSTLLILQHRFKAKVDSPEIELVKNYANLPLVECYAGQMNQVFMNVLSNAIDALEEYKSDIHRITIVTSLGKIKDNTQSVVIRITDNGPGIPADLITRICDPFFTTKPVGKGTGLGLSISYKIVVDKHDGVFKCESKPGMGTEFWIEIPLQHIKK